MEIIEVSGYSTEEKVEIAKQHLIPKQRKEHGLKAKDIKIPSTTDRANGSVFRIRKFGKLFKMVYFLCTYVTNEIEFTLQFLNT